MTLRRGRHIEAPLDFQEACFQHRQSVFQAGFGVVLRLKSRLRALRKTEYSGIAEHGLSGTLRAVS